MRIAVIGAGGVGGYFGGRLAQAGVDVAFVARGENLRALQRDGLRVESIAGDFVLPRVTVGADPRELGAADVVLVCVKGWQLEGAAADMGPLLHAGTCLVPLLNGVEAVTLLARAHGAGRVIGGSCRIMSFIAAPGHIRHAAIAPTITIGEMDGRSSDRVGRLRDVLARAAGVAVDVAPDIGAALWRKFMFITAWSGVGAATGQAIGDIRGRPDERARLEGAMREIQRLAAANGVRLADNEVVEAMAFIDRVAPDGTTSMQRDVAEGRPSELESLTGAVVSLADVAGLAVPLNAAIYQRLLPLERRARAKADGGAT